MGSLVTYVLQVSLILLIFGAIAFGLVRFAKRPTLGGTGPLELVARLHLEGRRVVYLIRAGGRLLVVGGSEAGLTRLGELDDDRALTYFVRSVIELRQAEPLLHRHSFRDGMVIRWLGPSGQDLGPDAWIDAETRSVGLLLSKGREPAYGDEPSLSRLLLLYNAHHEDVDFTLPDAEEGDGWTLLLDTAGERGSPQRTLSGGDVLTLVGRSMAVLGLAEPRAASTADGPAVP